MGQIVAVIPSFESTAALHQITMIPWPNMLDFCGDFASTQKLRDEWWTWADGGGM